MPIDLDAIAETVKYQAEVEGWTVWSVDTFEALIVELRAARNRLALADELAAELLMDKGDGKPVSRHVSAALTRYQLGGPSLASLALAWAEAECDLNDLIKAQVSFQMPAPPEIDAIIQRRQQARAAYEQARKEAEDAD
jgi:hypothetical protein